MLLRRWTTYSVELVLVVGILITLAIDGWLGERSDRKTEAVYLEMLTADLRQIETELHEQMEFAQQTNVAN